MDRYTEPRSSSRPLIDPEEALRCVCQVAQPLPPRCVPLGEAHGLQLAEDVRADRDYPPFPRAMMDGFAVRVRDAGAVVDVVGEVAAGQDPGRVFPQTGCLEIMTGAVCPSGTEAVVKMEQVHRVGNSVQLPQPIVAGSHITPLGSECSANRVVLRKGDLITPLAVAVLASFGRESVHVTPRPSLAVITTGSELVALGHEVSLGLIRDSNGPMLLAMARQMRVQNLTYVHADDRVDAILHALEQAAHQDIILLSGGVSVGNYDLVPQALDHFGVELIFHGVAQKPGKPLLLARKGSQLIFGMPGNPLGCHFGFHRYVAAAIRNMQGQPGAPTVRGRLGCPFRPKRSRSFFITGRAERSGQTHADWQIHPLVGLSSADIYRSWSANCYAEVPPGSQEIPAGHPLRFTWIDRG